VQASLSGARWAMFERQPMHRFRGLCWSRWVCAFRMSPAVTRCH